MVRCELFSGLFYEKILWDFVLCKLDKGNCTYQIKFICCFVGNQMKIYQITNYKLRTIFLFLEK